MINVINNKNNQMIFVNLYSDKNPMLDIGDICYFLLQNTSDFHLPIICRGKVIQDRFNESINKTYFISILEFIDSPKIIEKYLYNKSVALHNLTETGISNRTKQYIINKHTTFKFLENKLYSCSAFFVRKELSEIQLLRKNYMQIIENDLFKQISEIINFKEEL